MLIDCLLCVYSFLCAVDWKSNREYYITSLFNQGQMIAHRAKHEKLSIDTSSILKG